MMPLYSGAIVTALTEQLAQAEAEAERLLSELAALHPRTVAAEAALDRVRALCSLSEWLHAQSRWRYGTWHGGHRDPPDRLSPSAIANVRAAMNGPKSHESEWTLDDHLWLKDQIMRREADDLRAALDRVREVRDTLRLQGMDTRRFCYALADDLSRAIEGDQ